MDFLLYWIIYGVLWRLLWEHPYLVVAGLALWYFRDRIPNPARLFRRRQRIAHLQGLVALNPDNAEDQSELGELLIGAGRPVEAVPHLCEAACKAPDSGGIQFLLGLAHLRAGAAAEALVPLERASTLNRGLRYGEPLLRLGEAHATLGRWPEAEAAIEAHLAINASSAEGLYRLAAVRLAQGDASGARRAVEELRATIRAAPRFRRRLDRPWLRHANRLAIPGRAEASA